MAKSQCEWTYVTSIHSIHREWGTNGAVYDAKNFHNRSLALISSILSQKLDETVQTATNTITLDTILRTTTASVTGGIPYETQIVNASKQSSSTGTSANTVSWQTAFWALAAIALNTCLQDCGRVCAIQKEFGLLVRSSPIFCLVDTLIIILQWMFFTVTDGPMKAIHIVALSRDQHPPQLVAEDTRPAQFVARGILVTLAVIQSIKLFVLTGIPWTQFFGACYLLSYLVNTLLNVFGQPRSKVEAVALPQRGSMLLDRKVIAKAANMAAIAQLVVWIASLTKVLPDDDLESWDNVGILLHFTALLLTATPMLLIFAVVSTILLLVDVAIVLGPAGILLYLCYIQARREWPSLVELTSSALSVAEDTAAIGLSALFGSISLTLHIYFYPFSVLDVVLSPLMDAQGHRIPAIAEGVHPYAVVFLFISISAFVGHLVARVFFFGSLAEKLHLRQLSIASYTGTACLYLFAANVAFALVYFTKGYDSENTQKPGWTDNLGKFLF